MVRLGQAGSALPRGVALLVLALVGSVGVLALFRAPASAAEPPCTVRWVNPAGGAWGDSASWSGGTVPGPLDDVCIDTPGTYRVTLVTSPVGADAFLNLYTEASTHLLLDTFGYYRA